MSTTLSRPDTPEHTGQRPRRGTGTEGPRTWGPDALPVVELAVVALIAAAAVPFSQVFGSGEWVRPTAGVVLAVLGVAALSRRLRFGVLVTVALQVAALLVYCGVVFVPSTLLAGIVPTPATLTALADLVIAGVALLPERAAPTAVVPPFALLAVAGTGLIAAIADMLVHAGRAPLKAVVVALTMWAVPISMAPPAESLWPMTVPMVAAVALLLLATARADVSRWGRWVHGLGGSRVELSSPVGAGGVVASVLAIVAGVALAGTLPGFGERPWWDVRGEGGSTLTANPIVQMRSNLVASGTDAIFRVTSPRPVYLRTTALDQYGPFEEWTTSGIRSQPLVDGRMASGAPSNAFLVDVQVGDVARADLVPVPYQPLRATEGLADAFQLDPRTGTVVLDEGVRLEQGDRYSVITAVPAPSPAQLDEAGAYLPDDPMTALPADLPDEVAALAREITAGADTPFRQALAIQEELRTWEYSLDPPAGHDGSAMVRFLEDRIGYCEQFAGTMAVMLRTLDIPARVAVGFTPGQLVEEGSDTYAVSWSNSHAWVEVLFPELGWIAFEPTPRGDGNVLVPTSGDPSPQALAQPPSVVGQPQIPYAGASAAPVPEAQDFRSLADLPDQTGNAAATAADGNGGGAGLAGAAVVALLVLAVVAAVALRRAAAGPTGDAPPAERIVASGRRVERTGTGLGLAPRPTETDREYLHRLAVGSAAADEPARALADALVRARHAPSVSADDAARAQQAADAMVDALTSSLNRLERGRVQLRGGIAAAVAAARSGRVGRRLRRRVAVGDRG